MILGMKKAVLRIEKARALYERILDQSSGREGIFDLTSSPLFDSIIEYFGPALPKQSAKINLREIFDAALHIKSGALIVANKGVSLFCHSPISSIPYITRHIACALYLPHLGLESVNIGLVGDVYSDRVILRAESACAPSFLFGSQRCNCSYQWASIRELAAHFNPIDPPKGLTGEDFERWVQMQMFYKNGMHLALNKGPGVILMHLDSQGGMGSGFSEGEFVFDLYNRALMRQLGENSVEQVHHTSIKEGYECLGISPDSRREGDHAGYRVPPIILDWLQVSRSVIALSNNRFKLKQLQSHGYNVERVKSLGKIGRAGQREARQRGADFDHLDMDGEEITFEDEILRLKTEFSMNRPQLEEAL